MSELVVTTVIFSVGIVAAGVIGMAGWFIVIAIREERREEDEREASMRHHR